MRLIVISLFCVFTFCVSGIMFAQEEAKPEKSFLLFNVYESADKGYAKVIITENDQKIEEFELDGFHADFLVQNQIKITSSLSRYYRLGYKLLSSSKASTWIYGKHPNMTCMVTTYVMEK